MPTRTFVLEGETKKFWDISWDGLQVEITSGTWGTRGRARDASFAREPERDAFIAAEIAKAQKKGFRESAEVAPTPDASPPIANKVEALRALVDAQRKPAWLPHFAPGTSGVGVVRGPMTLDRDEEWPKCRVCGSELTGLFELDLSRVPAEHLRADSLVQLFWCEAWEENGSPDVCTTSEGGYLARRHRRGGTQREGRAQRRGTPSAIVDWARHEEVPRRPHAILERFEAATEEVTDALLLSVGANLAGALDEYDAVIEALGIAPLRKHKLAGFPVFVQDYARPFRAQIFQLEEKAPFDVNFGDVGAGHLLLGTKGEVEFTWASH